MSVPRNVTPLSCAARWMQAIELVEPRGHDVHPVGLHELVGAVEVDERDRRVAVLGFRRAGHQVLPERHRDRLSDVDRGDRDLDVIALEREGRRATPQEDALPLRLTQDVGWQGRRRVPAEEDLARGRRRLHVHGAARRRAGHHELPVRLAHEEEVEGAAVDPHGHPEHDLAGGGVEAADASQGSPHPMGGGRGPRSMPGPGEPEQEGVAAELQQAAVLAVGDREQLGEDGPEHLGDLLGAHLAVAGQALGHLREPGDVDEDHRSFEGPEGQVRLFGEPADQQPGGVRPQDLGTLGRRLRHERSLLRRACECTPHPRSRARRGPRLPTEATAA